ncbi:type II toxin-antitoxin system HicB family antitoxin [Pseudomonas monteilii]|uniref:type II toxin-antitoxin system HicB family antitoxin n=1 Tax=Pseudomonas monteilii TaxID=76759 RepID=UPI0015F89006|nr:type II toxin-antitoxin system HicB family antitoxin [Pseudomonas monteilii]MBA6092839.1 type II toxin-antitoxin system HicB family antitoxin [Pseudomonas monteilii]
MYDYKIVANEENGHYWSSCPDVPEAHSVGDTLEELLKNAVEGITLALSIYVDQKRQIPAASGAGDHHVRLPGVTVAKAILWNALAEAGKSRADLAAMLRISPTAAGRLVDFEHTSKLESLEEALALLGVRLQVTPVALRAA